MPLSVARTCPKPPQWQACRSRKVTDPRSRRPSTIRAWTSARVFRSTWIAKVAFGESRRRTSRTSCSGSLYAEMT